MTGIKTTRPTHDATTVSANIIGAGLIMIGPTPGPLAGIDELLACEGVQPIEAVASRMMSWSSASAESLELSRRTSRALRQGKTAVVYLDSHTGEGETVPPEAREFVCARLGQIMVGLADVPDYVALYCENMAHALVVDRLGDDGAETIATIPGGIPVFQLTRRSMFPGVTVAACPGDRPVSTIFDMVHWFQAHRDQAHQNQAHQN